ncbi:unnamed protein product [Ectocarpus sp. 13 AM-2016]
MYRMDVETTNGRHVGGGKSTRFFLAVLLLSRCWLLRCRAVHNQRVNSIDWRLWLPWMGVFPGPACCSWCCCRRAWQCSEHAIMWSVKCSPLFSFAPISISSTLFPVVCVVVEGIWTFVCPLLPFCGG